MKEHIELADELYFRPNSHFKSLITREELLELMEYSYAQYGRKRLYSIVLNAPAPLGSHNMRTACKPDEELFSVYLGNAQQHKYSVYANSEEDLFRKLIKLTYSNCEIRNLKMLKTGPDYPTKSFYVHVPDYKPQNILVINNGYSGLGFDAKLSPSP